MSNYPKRIYVLPTPRPRGMPVPRVVPSLTPSPSPPQRQLMKRAAIDPIETEQIVAELLGDDMGPSGPRKRERLNHLSQEEKMDRRKMKNRVAAQNARDKKKERSGKIEEVMRDLVEENARLRAENEQLRRQNEELLLQQQQQPTQYIHTPCYTPEHDTNTATDENIYSNVVYEEEVVDEQQDGGDRRGAVVVAEEEADQHAFESAVFINAPQPWDKAARSKSDNSSEDSHNADTSISQLSNSPSKRTDSPKKLNLNTYLSIISLLCNNQVEPTVTIKKNNSSESSIISRLHLMESSTDSSLTTLKKEPTFRRLQLQLEAEDPQSTAHLQKRVKHFRRHRLAVP